MTSNQLDFTGGPDEVRAWTVRKNTKAPQAAGVIHTDFEKVCILIDISSRLMVQAFVMAEVMKYEDLKEHGSENAVKGAGKYVQKGKEYIVQDGDILCMLLLFLSDLSRRFQGGSSQYRKEEISVQLCVEYTKKKIKNVYVCSKGRLVRLFMRHGVFERRGSSGNKPSI